MESPALWSIGRVILGRLPFDSVVGYTFRSLDREGFLNTLDVSGLTLDSRLIDTAIEKCIDAVIKVGLRAVSFFYGIPNFAIPISAYNLLVGFSHIGLGVVTFVQTQNKTLENFESIVQEYRAGFIHILTAVHDLALGLIFRITFFGIPIGLLTVIVISFIPQTILKLDQEIFKKAEPPKSTTPEEASPQQPEEVKLPEKPAARQYVVKECLISKYAGILAYKFISLPKEEVKV